MDTVRRDLHATTAQCSSLLTRYSKLAAQASTSYSSNGQLRDDLGRKKAELEEELDGALDTVSLPAPSSLSLLSVGLLSFERRLTSLSLFFWSIVCSPNR